MKTKTNILLSVVLAMVVAVLLYTGQMILAACFATALGVSFMVAILDRQDVQRQRMDDLATGHKELEEYADTLKEYVDNENREIYLTIANKELGGLADEDDQSEG